MKKGYGKGSESHTGNLRRNRNVKNTSNIVKKDAPKVFPAADMSSDEQFQEQSFREDLIEGRNPIMEALRSGRPIDKIYVSSGEKEGSIRQILNLAREKGIVVVEVSRSRLDSMSQSHSHQGIIAFAAVKEYVGVEDILESARRKGEPPFIVLLDEINDPHNLGSILRTAEAAGVHGVIIPKRRSVGLSSTVAKTSAGAVEYVPVARVSNLVQTIEQLKKQNIWVMGADMSGDLPFYEHDLRGPLALVIGSEGEGISRLVKESCDFLVRIPMKGNIQSLNASVAGAVIMYEVLKQRSAVT